MSDVLVMRPHGGLIWPLNEPDPMGVRWSLYAAARGIDLIPEIQTSGNGAVRADLMAISPYLPKPLREAWASHLREVLDLHLSVVSATEYAKAQVQEMRNVAVRAIQILTGEG